MRTINVTVQKGVNPFTGKPIYRIYDQNGFLLGRSCDTENEAMAEAAFGNDCELIIVNRTEINW